MEIKNRLTKLEQNLLTIKESLDIKTRILNVEKQIQNLNKTLMKNLAGEEQITNQNKQKHSKLKEELVIKNQVEEFDDNAEINFLDTQMLEYEATMEELEERAKLEKLNCYKPIHLNFCKSLEYTPPKIYHNITDDTRVDKILTLAGLKDLEKIEHKALMEVLKKYEDSVYLKGDKWDGVSANLGYHKINLKTDEPVNIKQYKLPYKLEQVVDEQVEEWLKMGVIEESSSPYNCPLYVIPKPKNKITGEQRWRVVTDFRALNSQTVTEEFPMPSIQEVIDKIGQGNKYFTKLDLSNGFLQIPVEPHDRHKMAFTTHRDRYQFRRMSFGMKNAPFYFQRAMTKVLKPLLGKGVLVYLDDILIYSKNLEEHIDLLTQVLELLKKHNFKIGIEKCEFLKKKVHYLGHIISEHGVSPDEEKIEAVKKFAQPRNQKHIRMFLGLCGFYRRYIFKFAFVSKILSDLLKKDAPFIWTTEHQKAFELLKQKLCEAPILIYPDLKSPFILLTDASKTCISGVLAQGTVKTHNPVAYYSRVLSPTEQRYSTYEREALAIYESIKHYRQYIYANTFTVYCDHLPLINMSEAENNGRVQRMRLKLQGYDFEIRHIKGKDNTVPDTFTRMPVSHLSCGIKMDRRKRFLKYKILSAIQRKRGRPRKYCEKFDENEAEEKREEELIDEDICLENQPRKRGRPRKIIQENKEKNKAQFRKASENEKCSAPEITNNETGRKERPKRNKQKKQEIEPTTAVKPKKKAGRPKAVKVQKKRKNLSDDDVYTSEDELIKDTDENESQKNPELNEEVEETENNIYFSKDLFEFQKGHILYLTNTDGEAYDEGAKRLKSIDKLPIRRKYEEKVYTLTRRKQLYVELCINKNNQVFVIKRKIKELLIELCKIIKEKKIKNLNICKFEELGLILWEDYLKLLRENISKDVKLIINENRMIYVDEKERNRIFEELHDSPIGGHRGILKSYMRISAKYFWPGMRKDIRERVRSCLKCQLNKIRRRSIKNPMRITDTPKQSFEKISCDIVGPYKKSPNNNQYVLTISCVLTKFLIVVPLELMTAIYVADALIARFISIFGCPRVILTDLGKNFISDVIRQIAKRMRIKKIFTTAYKPSSNPVERIHANVHEFLRQYSSEYDDWDSYIEMAALNHNTNYHESTGFTPYEPVFGKEAREPCVKPLESDITYGDYFAKLMKRLHLINEKARDNLIASKERNKFYFDKKAHPSEVNIGDKVLLKIDRSRQKLEPFYEGPFEVVDVDKKSKNVTILYKKKRYVVHLDRLRLTIS